MNIKPFMVEGGYCTSSKTIKYIIQTEGLSVFQIVKIKYFNNGKEARDYEVKFLHRIDAMHNNTFYNRHNGGVCVISNKGTTVPIEKRLRISRTLMGHPVSMETREKLRQAKLGVPNTEAANRKIRETNLLIQREIQNRPEVKLAKSIGLKKAFSDPQYREKAKLRSKEIQNRPEVIAKIKAAKEVFYGIRRQFIQDSGFGYYFQDATRKVIDNFYKEKGFYII